MRSHLQHVKLGSLGVWPRVLALCVGAAVSTTGCIFVDHDRDQDGTVIVDQNPTTDKPMLVDIDNDVALDAAPGDGVGVFVEYYTGGRYRIWTTCDTDFSGVVCPFDIFLSVDTSSTIDSVGQENLEGFDSTNLMQDQGALDLHFETDSDIDAAEINVTPGAILRVETFIDNQPQPRFVYWFGNGVLHEGAPTSPVDFAPIKP